jgi:hypothetical protein
MRTKTEVTSESGAKDCDKTYEEGSSYGSGWGCWFPLLIFIFIFIIVVIACFCSGYGFCGMDKTNDRGYRGSHIAAAVFLFFIIWILVLAFFCNSGDSQSAWFFLLLFIAIIIVWFIACFLGNLC